jgi:arginase
MSQPSSVSIIGAPTDVGAGHRGASMAPEALRVAGLAEALTRRGVEVLDRGNLTGPLNPWNEPVGGYRHLAEVVAWNVAVLEAVGQELAAGRVPLLLGGDHCLAVGSIGAVAHHCRRTKRRLVVLWLDAHADFNTSDVTPSGNVHGMPVACLHGLGPETLTGISGEVPILQHGELRQVGIRSVDTMEKSLVHEYGLTICDMRYIDEVGMGAAMREALDGVDADTHLHVSFDIDFLDPSIAPGVGTTVPGGPSYREAQLCMEMIADTGRVSSVDVMELNPAYDERNRTAELAVDLLESLFGKSTLMRR